MKTGWIARAFMALLVVLVTQAARTGAQQVDCPDSDEGPICINAHSRDVSFVRSLVEFERRAAILLDEWRQAWPKPSITLIRRMRIWRSESAAFTEMLDDDVPPSGVTYVRYSEGDITNMVVMHETRVHYFQFAFDAAFAKCLAAVKPLMKAATVADGLADYDPASDLHSTDTISMRLAQQAAGARRECERNDSDHPR